jgi:hypothetical protein
MILLFYVDAILLWMLEPSKQMLVALLMGSFGTGKQQWFAHIPQVFNVIGWHLIKGTP